MARGQSNDNAHFRKQFLDELKQKGKKSLGGAVGLPDEKDWQNIRNIIALYRRESMKRYGYDRLVDCITQARKEYREAGRDYSGGKFAVVNKASSMRYHFELPENLVGMIQLAYPLMFTDRDHYHWFCKHFAELGIAEKF